MIPPAVPGAPVMNANEALKCVRAVGSGEVACAYSGLRVRRAPWFLGEESGRVCECGGACLGVVQTPALDSGCVRVAWTHQARPVCPLVVGLGIVAGRRGVVWISLNLCCILTIYMHASYMRLKDLEKPDHGSVVVRQRVCIELSARSRELTGRDENRAPDLTLD